MIEELMKNPDTKMNDKFIEKALGNAFPVWKKFCEYLEKADLSLEWRCYKDGGWLAKITQKKKTIIWSSISDGFFQASFLFSAKPHLRSGVEELDISEELKKNMQTTPTGTYFSILIDVYNENQLSDVYKLTEYKKKAK